MNKYALHVAGGALLATTALASGTVYAASYKYGSAGSAVTAIAAGIAPSTITSAVGVATNIFTSTSSAVTVGPLSIILDAANFSNTQTTIQITVTGAEFDTTAMASNTEYTLFEQETTSTASLTSSHTIGTTAFVTSDKITLNGITGVTWGALGISGIQFRNAQGLATSGGTIALGGTIFNSAGVLTLEGVTTTTVLQSKVGVAVEVTGGSAITVNNTSSPTQFSTVTQTGAGTASAVLSVVKFTDNLTVGKSLAATQSAATLMSSYEVKLSHGVLNDTSLSASLGVGFSTSNGVGIITKTSAQFVSGTVTFSPNTPSAGGATGITNTLVVNFTGTSVIAAQAAGTTTVTPTIQAATVGGVAAVSGTAAALSRGGMNATVNLIQPSTNTSSSSYIRITNIGSNSGTVTVQLRNASTGAVLGSSTFTSASIPAGGTIQVSAAQLEQGSGVTPASGVQYDATVSGSITGFVQHIGFNATTGALSDLTGFRAGGSGAIP